MLFWLVATALTILASLAVLWPLARRSHDVADEGNDLRVYKDQLTEVDNDLARGAIRSDDAEQAKDGDQPAHCEIGWRFRRTISRCSASGAFRIAALAAVLAVPVVSWGLYAVIGSPDLPSQPLQARLNKAAERKFCRRASRTRRKSPGEKSGRRTRMGCTRADLCSAEPVRRRSCRLSQRDPARAPQRGTARWLGRSLDARQWRHRFSRGRGRF